MKNRTVKDKVLSAILTPISWVYAGVMWIRNKLFDTGVFHEESFDIPVISVGNITVGGTGKTPHVEYLVSCLSSVYNIAVLSRGYKRKTKGYIEANAKSTPDQIGDEPMQIFQKYGSRIKVAVCENRRKGIRELMRTNPDLEMVILDDAFQHRWVKPRVSILLMDYNRPIYNDHILPLGRLRESTHSVNRADMVIVTKCPTNMTPLQYRLVSKELDLMSYQKLYFSHYSYGGLLPVFPDNAPYHVSIGQLTENDAALLVTGVAHPRYFVRHFKQYPFKIKVDHFPDHHDFSRQDIDEIRQKFNQLKGDRKVIITTEKDAVRLSCNPYVPRDLKPYFFYLPIGVEMDYGFGDNDLIRDLRDKIEKPDVLSGHNIPQQNSYQQ